MGNPFNTKLLQVLAKIQTAAGTFQTLAAADGKMRLWEGAKADYQAPKNPRNVARQSLSKYSMIGGTKAFAYALRTEFNTPDTMTSVLECEALLRASGHAVTQLKKIAIGAISGGPVARNATVTGGTSAGTGRVVIPATTADPFLYYVVLTGALQSAETLSFTGGASCASTGAPASWGWSVKPVTPTEIISLELQEDGYAWSARDAMAKLALDCENSKQGFMDFSVLGVKNAAGAKAMTSGIAYDSQDPPVFQDTQTKLGSYLPVLNKWTFDQGNKLGLRGDANATGNTGLKTGRVSDRDPRIKIMMEHVPESTFDLFANYDSSVKLAFQSRIGTVSGKTGWFFGDEACPAGFTMSETENARQVELDLLLTSTTDNNEYEMVFA